jgi:outer membrane receptor protein involved in Fe transport
MLATQKANPVVYRDLYQLGSRPETLGRYSTVDVTARLFLSKQFLVYCIFQNIFDREHAGLDASGTPDDLIYNPQPGRFVRLGVNYNMN